MSESPTSNGDVASTLASNASANVTISFEEQLIAYGSLYTMALLCILVGAIRSVHFVQKMIDEKKPIEASITTREAKKFPLTASAVLFGLYIFFKYGDTLKELFDVYVLHKSADALAGAAVDAIDGTSTRGRLLSMLPAISKANAMLLLLLLLCWEGCVAMGHILKPVFTFVLNKLPIDANRQPRRNLPYVLQFTRGKQPVTEQQGQDVAATTEEHDELFKIEFDTHDIVAIAVCLLVGISHINRRHWISNNLLGIAFSIYGIEALHLASFKAGGFLLAGLFAYDIFWVFATDVMTTVAKGIDAPILLQFPQDLLQLGWDAKRNAMLGLGDIVIPGIFIALLRRFDARITESPRARGARPRYYFATTLVSYACGLLLTMFVMHAFKAAQPALLYLVPACLLVPLTLAKWRGELHELYNYSEEHLTKKDEKTSDEKKTD